MAYTYLIMNELDWIEIYYNIGYKPYDKITKKLARTNKHIYNVVNFLKQGGTVRDYFDQYRENKSKCGAKKKIFTRNQTQYIKNRVADGWTHDVIIGRGEKNLVVQCALSTDSLKKVSCSM